MTNAEALNSLYGEISTERDGDITHQCIQTNLADVICGGNPNDKIMYARNCKKRSASFPTPRSLERRHSLRLFGSSKRLQRCVSSRSLSKNALQQQQQPHQITDSSSSEYHSTDSSSPSKMAKAQLVDIKSHLNVFNRKKCIVAITSLPKKRSQEADRHVLRTISSSWMVQFEGNSFAQYWNANGRACKYFLIFMVFYAYLFIPKIQIGRCVTHIFQFNLLWWFRN